MTLTLVAAPPAGAAQPSPRPDARGVWSEFPLDTQRPVPPPEPAARARELSVSTAARDDSHAGFVLLSTTQLAAVSLAVALVLVGAICALVYLTAVPLEDVRMRHRDRVRNAGRRAATAGSAGAGAVKMPVARIAEGEVDVHFDASETRPPPTAIPAEDAASDGLGPTRPTTLAEDQVAILKAKLGKPDRAEKWRVDEVEVLRAKLEADAATQSENGLRPRAKGDVRADSQQPRTELAPGQSNANGLDQEEEADVRSRES